MLHKISKVMKTIILFVVLVLSGTLLNAQESSATIKQDSILKKSRKEIRRAKMDADYQRTKQLLTSKKFVLEADWLSSQTGPKVPVTANLNFILVDSAEAVIQTGNNFSTGLNGLGGTTATGTINTYEVRFNDGKRSLSLKMEVSTSIGHFTIFANITPSANCTATLGGMRAGKLIYYGQLVPLEASFAYKGSSL